MSESEEFDLHAHYENPDRLARQTTITITVNQLSIPDSDEETVIIQSTLTTEEITNRLLYVIDQMPNPQP